MMNAQPLCRDVEWEARVLRKAKLLARFENSIYVLTSV